MSVDSESVGTVTDGHADFREYTVPIQGLDTPSHSIVFIIFYIVDQY